MTRNVLHHSRRLAWGLLVATLVAAIPSKTKAAIESMSATRHLRRVTMTLLGRAPTVAEYEGYLGVPEAQRQAVLDVVIDSALTSPEFAAIMQEWGKQYLRTTAFTGYDNLPATQFKGLWSQKFGTCPTGSLHDSSQVWYDADGIAHTGRIGLFHSSNIEFGQNPAICDDPGAPLADIEPWWNPGTTIPAIGDVAEADGVGLLGEDCGGGEAPWRAIAGCGCGPNLVYCRARDQVSEGTFDNPNSLRNEVSEEPSKLFSYIVMQDRPFSDLILGNYTVATRGVHMAYIRQARKSSENAWLDYEQWWRDYGTNPFTWREVPINDLNPQLLSERTYTFDPRVDPGRPMGIPAAGVLTTLVSNNGLPRERVRAAAWLRSFACREFTPPSPDITFPPYNRDPGTEGSCIHCHQLIDPAAIHFKRMFGQGAMIAGTTDNTSLVTGNNLQIFAFRGHAENLMISDTLMTPVSQAVLNSNSDARLIDFLTDGTTLFGHPGDGTIGPLGFAKVLVETGEFDQCAVRRAYQRFGGRDLVPGQDDALLRELRETFVTSGRSMKSLIRAIVNQPEFKLGL